MSAVLQSLHPQLDIRRVAGRIGAEIRGVALSGDLDAATVAAIRQALVTHKVVFFRDQNLDGGWANSSRTRPWRRWPAPRASATSTAAGASGRAPGTPT